MKKNDAKILFVLENYYPNIGGVEKLFKCLSDKLIQNKFSATVITTKTDDSSPKYEKINTIEIFRYNFLSRYLFSFLAIAPIFRKLKNVDFIHTTSYNAGLPAIIVGVLRKKKVIITFHEVWGKLWFDLPQLSIFAKWGHYLFEALLLKMPFHKFIAVSDFTAQMLHKYGISKNRIIVIKNGIDYEEIQNILEQSTDINVSTNQYCYFGRLGISKGLDLLLPAWQKFVKDQPNKTLKLIIPKTPKSFLEKIKKEISDLKLNDSIQIVHELSYKDLLLSIKESYAVIIPSYSEGFCFAAAETMAVGTPIISSGKGALAEVVNGKFIQMEEFTSNGLYEALVKSAKSHWTQKQEIKFPLDQTLNQYLKVYEKLLVSK